MRPRRFSGVMVAAAIAWLAATLSPLAQRERGRFEGLAGVP